MGTQQESPNAGNEVILSGRGFSSIPGSQFMPNVDFGKITYIDLSYNQISNLSGLEIYPNLDTLILDCNSICDISDMPFNSNVTTLSLNKNNVSDLDLLLENLKHKTKSLRFLSLLGNPCCPNQLIGPGFDENDYHRYRCYVVYSLPNIKFLDSTLVTKREKEEAMLRGQYLKVINPVWSENGVSQNGGESIKFHPLPPAKSNLLPHRGIYGACRYRYTGKNSEGNRFIRNNDL